MVYINLVLVCAGLWMGGMALGSAPGWLGSSGSLGLLGWTALPARNLAERQVWFPALHVLLFLQKRGYGTAKSSNSFSGGIL